MKKNKTDDELLAKEGWEIVCQSPFEIEDGEGGFARHTPAKVYIDSLRYGIRYGKSKDEKLAKKARNLVELFDSNCITNTNFAIKMYELFKDKKINDN